MREYVGRRFSSVGWVGLMIVLMGASAMAQPKISIEKSKIEFGTIYNGAVKKARIVIRNVGRDTLRVLGVTTSCGCTTVRQPKGTLKPGESDAVEIEFNSTGFRGPIEKHVDIMTNDPVTPSSGITLTGNVIDELQPVNSNSVLWLGSVPVGKQVEISVALKNVSGKVITLMGYKSPSPDLIVLFGNHKVLPADTVQFSVRITPRKTDYISELLLLQTDSNKQSEVPIRITLIGVSPN